MSDNKVYDRHIYRLDELSDFEIADGDPDIRGWQVFGSDGKAFGTVQDLLIDPKLMRVRYFDVVTTDDLAWGGGERHLLIPIGAAQLHAENDKIFVNGIDVATLRRFPIYNGEPVVRDYEHSLRATILNDASRTADDDFYNHDMYNEDSFFSPRRTHNEVPQQQAGRSHIFRRP